MRKRTRRNTEGELLKPRQIRWGFMIMWAVLLGVVIVFVSGILPGGRSMMLLSGRSERRRLQTGEKMEQDSLWLTAADTYQSLVSDPKVSAPVKAKAAGHLARIYDEKLPDDSAAIKALESAYFYTSDAKEKRALEARLAGHRAKLKDEAAGPASSAQGGLSPPPEGATVVARIGGETVTLEDILYAWSRSKPRQQPKGEDLEAHAINYLNQALLAVEARRRHKDKSDGYVLEQRYFERQLLAQSLLGDLAPRSNDEAANKKYYEEHLDKYQEPPSALLRHILIKDKEGAEAAAGRLAAGEDFLKLAAEVSVDRTQLPEGGAIGRFAEGDDFIPYVGNMPSLMKRLLKLEDGGTTGPIQTARGFHLFRIEEKKAGQARPYEQVADKVAREARAEAMRKAQEDLLSELRKSTGVEIDEKAMQEGFARLQERQRHERATMKEGPPAPQPPPGQP